jgi:ATP-dependent DNA helicase RecQ
VPAYIVFSDGVLADMARQRPKDRNAMLAISGVGAVKLERYGEAFLDVIKATHSG